MGLLPAACQRAIAHCVSPPDQIDHVLSEGDMVPGNIFNDVIRRDPLVEMDFHSTCRVCVTLDNMLDPGLFDLAFEFVAKGILTKRTYSVPIGTVFHRMVTKISRGAACPLAAGKHIPQELAQSYNNVFII